MPDFPDFTIPKWDRRDWSAKEATFKTWALYSTDPIDPGDDAIYIIYSPPLGKRAYYADSYLAAEFMGLVYLYIEAVYFLHVALVEPYETSIKVPSIPLTAEAGELFQVRAYNDDTVAGRARFGFTIWEEPASKPKKPKSDDPEERYKLGDFNFANILLLPGEEMSIIFGKRGEKKRNYLRVKNFYRSGEKKLASFHLKIKEANEILDVREDKPEKIKKVLKKFEEKYKSKAPKF